MSLVVINDTIYLKDGKVGIGTSEPRSSLDIGSSTDGILVPKGTTLQRPAIPSNGLLRYNVSLDAFEIYVNGWITIASNYTIITSVSPTLLPNSTSTAVIIGKSFSANTTFKLKGLNGTLYSIDTFTVNSSTQVTFTRPENISADNQPYSLLAINQASVAYSLDNVINITQTVLPSGFPPVITSTTPILIAASTVLSSSVSSALRFEATTPLASPVVWTLTSSTGSLYGNSINSTLGTITFTFAQGTTASGTFTVTATNDYGSVSQSWGFNITNVGAPTSITPIPAAIDQNTASASYTTSYSFSAPNIGTAAVTWAIYPTTYASLNSSSGALTVNFPISTGAFGSYTLVATNAYGSTSVTWAYSIAPWTEIVLDGRPTWRNGYPDEVNSSILKYNLRNDLVSRGYNPDALTYIKVINNGYIYSDNVNTAAFDTGTYTGTKYIRLENNGAIMGQGGDAGELGSPGNNGGPAMTIRLNIIIMNNGLIGGGGGGGGSTQYAGGGGGAGGGRGKGNGTYNYNPNSISFPNDPVDYGKGGTGGCNGIDGKVPNGTGTAGGGGGSRGWLISLPDTEFGKGGGLAGRAVNNNTSPNPIYKYGGGGGTTPYEPKEGESGYNVYKTLWPGGGGGGAAILYGPNASSGGFMIMSGGKGSGWDGQTIAFSTNNYGHAGGGGGEWGTAGGRGLYYVFSNNFTWYAGGAAGKAVNLNGNTITWISGSTTLNGFTGVTGVVRGVVS